MSLIAAQDKCIARMSESRTSEKRAAKNRNAALAEFRDYCERKGYSPEIIKQLAQDVRDMYALQRDAED